MSSALEQDYEDEMAKPSPSPEASSSDSDENQGRDDNGEEEEEVEEEEEEEEGVDDDEEEEEGVEEEEDEEEGHEKEEGDESAQSSEDTSQNVDSDKNDEDPGATSLTLDKSRMSVVSHGQDIGGCGDDLPSVNQSKELAEKQFEEVCNVDDKNFIPAILGTSIAPDENKPLEKTNEVSMLVMRMSTGASGNIFQNDVSEIHKVVQDDGIAISADNTKLLCVEEDEVVVGALPRDGFGDCEPRGISYSEKEMKNSQMENDVQSADDLKLNASRSQTPQQRPRSLTPDDELDNTSKRPAILCDFFARGWCIKGSSCKFLHQKPGFDNAGQWTKGNVVGTGELVGSDYAGLRIGAERSRPSISVEPSNADNPPHLSERFLPHEFGQSRLHHMFHEGGKSSLFQREDFFPRSYNSSLSIQDDFLKFDSRGKGWSFGTPSSYQKLDPHLNTVGNHDIFHGNYPTARMHHELPKGVHLNDEHFARGSTLFSPMHNATPGCRPLSSGTFIPSRVYGDDNYMPHSTIQNKQSQMSLPTAGHASTLNSSLMPGFSTSLRSIYVSPSQLGTTSTRGSAPFSAEHFSAQNHSDYDKGLCIDSRSASLPRSSSPYYSRSESEDLPVSVGLRSKFHLYDWEPSVPFRSSFHCPPPHKSSPGSQYDPLVDSISSPFKTSTLSQGTLSYNTTQQQPNGDAASARSRSPEYNAEKCLYSFHESREGSFDKNTCRQGTGGYTTEEELTGKLHIADVETGTSVAKAVESLGDHDHKVSSVNTDEVDLDGSAKHQMEKSRHSKNAKATKLFHAALVDFVKELVKPSWREGHLSKDSHKMIVKKAVDKVLSTLRLHQIPNTTESIKEYLSSSGPKLKKLVEGYVEKYAKS
ncbi:zinc finger CCCH domain-containing protein 36-like protein isoform X1 [Cinnamomum micranthum f. kanehirae]|uniref:Zinc finger CCCH domain-containing protein 36-like protein isoform X1 n=1 Tax=Cinnamomum micranthum f. kanehirae TaxID=337451 RepID=A0A443N3E6_9MAGN|nr:zinc finger CCCH domain-containing protein 36-like protein isoform X1 [Cinnamomum micranthum f. kanehirae]